MPIIKEITVWGINDPDYPYRRGDFISFKDHPRTLGSDQVPPKFYRIVVGFANEGQWNKFLEFLDPEWGDEVVTQEEVTVNQPVLVFDESGVQQFDSKGNPLMADKEVTRMEERRTRPTIHRRAWRLLMDDLPQQAKDRFQQHGFIVIGPITAQDVQDGPVQDYLNQYPAYTWMQVRDRLRRKRDEAVAEDITQIN